MLNDLLENPRRRAALATAATYAAIAIMPIALFILTTSSALAGRLIFAGIAMGALLVAGMSSKADVRQRALGMGLPLLMGAVILTLGCALFPTLTYFVDRDGHVMSGAQDNFAVFCVHLLIGGIATFSYFAVPVILDFIREINAELYGSMLKANGVAEPEEAEASSDEGAVASAETAAAAKEPAANVAEMRPAA